MFLYITGICTVESERWYQQQQTVEIDLKTEKIEQLDGQYFFVNLTVCTCIQFVFKST